jgi:hypothetical protein
VKSEAGDRKDDADSSHATEDEDEQDAAPSQDEVYEDFSNSLNKHGVTDWGGKFVTRKYAFELQDVPRETEYLKAVYGFDRTRAKILASFMMTVRLRCQ